MEHTPKNILIRAVYDPKLTANTKQLQEMEQLLHADLTISKLLPYKIKFLILNLISHNIIISRYN